MDDVRTLTATLVEEGREATASETSLLLAAWSRLSAAQKEQLRPALSPRLGQPFAALLLKDTTPQPDGRLLEATDDPQLYEQALTLCAHSLHVTWWAPERLMDLAWELQGVMPPRAREALDLLLTYWFEEVEAESLSLHAAQLKSPPVPPAGWPEDESIFYSLARSGERRRVDETSLAQRFELAASGPEFLLMLHLMPRAGMRLTLTGAQLHSLLRFALRPEASGEKLRQRADELQAHPGQRSHRPENRWKRLAALVRSRMMEGQPGWRLFVLEGCPDPIAPVESEAIDGLSPEELVQLATRIMLTDAHLKRIDLPALERVLVGPKPVRQAHLIAMLHERRNNSRLKRLLGQWAFRYAEQSEPGYPWLKLLVWSVLFDLRRLFAASLILLVPLGSGLTVDSFIDWLNAPPAPVSAAPDPLSGELGGVPAPPSPDPAALAAQLPDVPEEEDPARLFFVGAIGMLSLLPFWPLGVWGWVGRQFVLTVSWELPRQDPELNLAYVCLANRSVFWVLLATIRGV
jgi:hypothetical protein